MSKAWQKGEKSYGAGSLVAFKVVLLACLGEIFQFLLPLPLSATPSRISPEQVCATNNSSGDHKFATMTAKKISNTCPHDTTNNFSLQIQKSCDSVRI